MLHIFLLTKISYLWEREEAAAAWRFFDFGLSLDVDREGPICNPAIRLLGHIALDMARPEDALEAYFETLTLRLKLAEADSPAIADVYDSIACSYTELGNTEKAFEYLDKSVKIHEAHDPQCMARTSAVMAMTYLRAGKPDQALEALTHCWQLQGKTESQIARSKYPKHSGDIVLLSRIQYAQGKKESAIELASKSITIRRGILGERGPRVADSMYLVAGMLRAEGKQTLATKLLGEIVEASQGLVEMEGHLARALWSLGGLEEELGNFAEARALKTRAQEVRCRILRSSEQDEEDSSEDKGQEFEVVEVDEEFQRLVGYMLW